MKLDIGLMELDLDDSIDFGILVMVLGFLIVQFGLQGLIVFGAWLVVVKVIK